MMQTVWSRIACLGGRFWARLVGRAAVCWWLALSGVLASAQTNFIKEQAWFEDRSGVLTLAQARQQTFTPFSGTLSLGFGASPVWVRLLIDPRTPGHGDGLARDQAMAEQLVLRIAPAQLDEIELFDALDEQTGRRVTGDHTAWSSQEYPSLAFSFVIPSGTAERYVWLRLHTTSSRLLHVEAVSLREQHRTEMLTEVFTAGYLGLLVFFVGWALNIYVMAPERLLALFVLKQIGAVIYALFALGYARMLLDGVWDPVTIEWLSKLCVWLYALMGTLYQMAFLKELDPPEQTDWIFRVLLLGFPLALGLLMLDHHRQALIVLALLVFFVILASMLVTSLGRYKSYSQSKDSVMLPKRVLLALHGVLLSSMLVVVFPVVGLLRGSIYLLYAPMVHAVISGSILVYVLQVRAYRKAAVSEKIESEYAMLEEKLQLEKAFREEQQNLLAMLAHEIKTPLSVIRLLAKRKTPSEMAMVGVDQAATEMSAIVDRCIQAGRSVDIPETVLKTRFEPVQMMRELVHSRAGGQQVNIVADPDLSLEADQQLIRMALSNLLDNACRYGDPRQAVRVAIRRSAENGVAGLRFSFVNALGSAGWPDAERVFSKYYRSPHAHRQSGSGLGLYLVAAFARQCGGAVRYRPTDEAIWFELWIPI